ncbi:MAG: hypothetical protein IJ812_09900, partial [Schwartzia sp.]|nr:hypothetical protein [Schwartzia sp. (in: firmicutes)]
EQIREVEEACKHPIVYDEDCPELSDEQIERMVAMAKDANRNRQPLSLRVLPATARIAKQYGEAVIGRLLDLAVQDEAMIQKCL